MQSDCPAHVSFASALSLFSTLAPHLEGITNPPTETHLYDRFGWGGGGRVETMLLPLLSDENTHSSPLPELLLKASPFSASPS